MKNNKQTTAPNGVILGAIILTLFSTFVFWLLVYDTKSLRGFTSSLTSVISPWLGIPLYLIFHPIIGKLFSAIVQGLCNATDRVYRFNGERKLGNWTSTGSILFAAAWPLAGPIGLVVSSIALLYGLLFKGLLRNDN